MYKAFRLNDLTTKEWEALSTEVCTYLEFSLNSSRLTLKNKTAQAIVKETIAGRKNTSPQNIYETNQLYSAGALKVACVGLQCVGFNNAMYRSILAQAAGEKLKADTLLGADAGQARNCTPVGQLANSMSGMRVG